ncbi:MAG: hypothetical protein AAF738_09175, partial [Bacteroidota bacterium]
MKKLLFTYSILLLFATAFAQKGSLLTGNIDSGIFIACAERSEKEGGSSTNILVEFIGGNLFHCYDSNGNEIDCPNDYKIGECAATIDDCGYCCSQVINTGRGGINDPRTGNFQYGIISGANWNDFTTALSSAGFRWTLETVYTTDGGLNPNVSELTICSPFTDIPLQYTTFGRPVRINFSCEPQHAQAILGKNDERRDELLQEVVNSLPKTKTITTNELQDANGNCFVRITCYKNGVLE